MNKENPCCEYMHIHQKAVDEVLSKLPGDEVLWELSDLFKIFGDSTRLKILYLLFEKELCVCDIANILNMSQSAVSHQLKTLKTAKLVKYKKVGKTVFYSLADNHVHLIIAQGKKHLEEK